MVKNKKLYVCQVCGYSSPKWQGRCPRCGEWESFLLEEIKKEDGPVAEDVKILKYDEIDESKEERFSTGLEEFDRVLGGGVVKGAVILIGGNPGAGKSTLLLQMAFNLSSSKKVLYVSGEESLPQIKMRGKRLGGKGSEKLFLLSTTSFEKLEKGLAEVKPDVLIVDSIQTVGSSNFTSATGTVVQINYCARKLVEFAKSSGCSIFLVGHITKGGIIAGPKILEHLVDVVLYFEGNSQKIMESTRILRSIKNRFGAVNEVGIFRMESGGLVSVLDPSQIFLSEFGESSYGVSYFCTIEGIRPIVVEIQALVSLGNFSNARRMSTTYDRNRISLLLAMLERVTGLNLIPADVYLNVAGGITVNEPGADLSVLASIISSFKRIPLPSRALFLGEMGLSGNLRKIPLLFERIREAKKLGFKRIFLPPCEVKEEGIEVIKIKNINDLMEII